MNIHSSPLVRIQLWQKATLYFGFASDCVSVVMSATATESCTVVRNQRIQLSTQPLYTVIVVPSCLVASLCALLHHLRVRRFRG